MFPFYKSLSLKYTRFLLYKTKQVCVGIPVKCIPTLKKAALPYANRHDLLPDTTALTLSCSLPGSFRTVLALEGRRKPVIGLQRHPLIYPIFRPHPWPLSF
jgi:hypothetical protein